MRKWTFVLLTVTAFLALAIAPAFAQEGTIVDIAVAASQADEPQFTVLVQAVVAAGLADELAAEGPFTVFAPTDEAFINLLTSLNLSAEDVLANTDLLTQVLLYHVVSGAFPAADVVGLDGQSVETLQGESIAISIVDGGVVLNGDVNVIQADVLASNGVIHVIDKVLLPPSVVASLAGETTEAMDGPIAHIRVAHLSPDTFPVDIYINGEESAVQDLAFPTITDWISIPAGTYEIAVAPAGTFIEAAIIGPAELTFAEDSWTTIAAIGSLQNSTIKPALIAEDYYNDTLAEGQAYVTVFHAIEDAPAVDVRANGSRIVSSLAFPGTVGDNDGVFDFPVPAGTYDLQVVPAGARTPVVLDLPGTTLEAGTFYFVAAAGTLEAPQVVVKAVNPAAMMMEGEMGEMEEALPSIAEIVVASASADTPEFTTLLAAVQAAGLTEALAGEGTFTVFAPTDAAFAAAFEALGIAPADLLADTDTLTSILTYHALGEVVPAEVVVTLDGQEVVTLNGAPITISIVDDGVVLNGTVNVIQADIMASNGVIHVIDAVLLPPTE